MKDLEFYQGMSQKMLIRLQEELSHALPEKYKNHGVCIYACGSLGRLEFGNASDLDAFYIVDNLKEGCNGPIPKVDREEFFSVIRRINSMLDFPPPSKGGKYLVFTPRKDLFDIGSQEEDSKNSYTARMLLLLESKPLYNKQVYDKLIEDVVDQYFIDYPDHTEDFNPLYLMNDIKRYWYTLCLNYENRRNKNDDRAERYRKRLKLKFARRVTCFSMLACLYKKGIDKSYVVTCTKMTPFERFEMLAKDNEELTAVLENIKQMYVHYLELKTHDTLWWEEDPNRKAVAFRDAGKFQRLINNGFMQRIACENPELLDLMDLY